MVKSSCSYLIVSSRSVLTLHFSFELLHTVEALQQQIFLNIFETLLIE